MFEEVCKLPCSYSWASSSNEVLGENSCSSEKHGIPFYTNQTIQYHCIILKDKFLPEWEKQGATSGIESFWDDNNPCNQLMEDLVEEIKDSEGEKSQRHDETYVAGGQKLCDKAAYQILGGLTVAVAGMQSSPTSSVRCYVSATKSKEPSTISNT